MSDGSERRRHRRVSVSLPVVVGDETEISTQDISEGGVGVLSTRPMEAGATIEVELLLDAAVRDASAPPLKTMAKVMWSAESDTGGYTAGLRFDGPSPEAVKRLRKFLDSHD